MGFLLDLINETVHGLSSGGKVVPKPLTIESGWHRLKLLRCDIDDPGHVGDAAIVVRALNHWDEFVLRVFEVFGVLTIFVAVVFLAVQEGDDQRVFEPDGERVRAFPLARAGNQMISKQGPGSRAVDEDVSRREHGHRLLRRHDRCSALHRP